MGITQFSNVYDDMPNCQFYMNLKKTSRWGVYKVTYFTAYSDGIYDSIVGEFKNKEELKNWMNGNPYKIAKNEQPTARLWMYIDELWDSEIKRLESE